MDRGRNNNRGGGKAVKAKGGAVQNSNAPRKLSDRFDRIVHSQAVAKPVRGQNQNNKGKKVVIVQKGSNPKNGAKGATKGGKGGKGANAPQGKKDNKKKDGKNGKAAAKPVKEKPKTADELDLEMATYWHKAGKGPDPMQAKLDAEMDSYFAKKDEVVEEAPAVEEPVAEVETTA